MLISVEEALSSEPGSENNISGLLEAMPTIMEKNNRYVRKMHSICVRTT